MCCPGCEAVASLIAGSGLDAFYRLRTAVNERPAPPESQNAYRSYDQADAQAVFINELDDGWKRAQLLLGGVSCAACTWLIEQSLGAEPHFRNANVSLARQTLTVEFDPSHVAPSELFQRLVQLGYDPHPWQSQHAVSLIEDEQRNALRQLAVAGLAMMQVGMFGIALHAGDIQGIAPEYRGLMRWVSLIIASIVVFYSARSFFRNAWVNLRHARLVMDLPVALAIGLAYLASLWATLRNTGEVYFDSIAMFTFFLLLGRYLERQIRRREVLRQTDLQSLLPISALRWSEQQWHNVATRDLHSGDRLLVRTGEVFPADGRVEQGSGAVDEAAFTGEQMPRPISVGDPVSAGTLLTEGTLEVSVLADAANSRLSVMLELLQTASEQKPRLAQLADRVAARFVGVLLIVASSVAVYWTITAPEQAFWITLSVLVVSCPCALALATPTAITAATSSLRRGGLLLTGENTLENLTGISHVIFDKTGTLTKGHFRIKQHEELDSAPVPFDQTSGTVSVLPPALNLAAALEQQSNHPIAEAFASIAPAAGLTETQVIPGRGIRGRIQGQEIAIGGHAFLSEICAELPYPPDSPDHWIGLATSKSLLAWFALEDSPRTDAAELIAALKAQGLCVELLTGDSSPAGPGLGHALGIDVVNYGMSPADKVDHIRSLQEQGKRVAMIGDGLNDAPVLAAADCAFAVNQATDLAKSSADGILLSNKLLPLSAAFETARQCRRVIWQNMAWALAYNGSAVPLAAAGLIPPWAAALGMSASSLLVVLNSLRLK